MTSTEIVPVGQRTLEELAEVINREHHETIGALVNALQHCIACGDALLEARQQFNEWSAGWGPWCEANVDMAGTTVNNYMRLAYYREYIPAELLEAPYHHNRPGRNVALQYLKGLPPIFERGRGRKVNYDEARRLVDAGVPKKEVARMLGTDSGTIRRAVLSAAERKRFDDRKKRLKRERELTYKRAQDNKIAKAKGGNLSHAYSLLRRSLDAAQYAHDDSHGNLRDSIAQAIHKMHQAEDMIGKALRGAVSGRE